MAVVFVCVMVFQIVALQAEETPIIDPAKAEQLRRLEPLTAEKIEIFVESGQLTAAQADYIKKHIGHGGQLALPDAAIAPERKTVPVRRDVSDTAQRVASAVSSGPYTEFNYKFSGDERERLTQQIKAYRRDDQQQEIGRLLRKSRPQVNELIAAAYTDPIDLPIKIALEKEVAGPSNPDAAIGLFETHRAAYDLARPVLIPYAKDVGSVLVRRLSRHPDANSSPQQRFFTSRELRDMIEDIEGLISRCAGPSAAIFLMNIYSQRYDKNEAPLRDDGRDRQRLVAACGGSPKKFEDDESKTWGSSLSQRQRAIIAERLIPWLSKRNDDRRKIARSALRICLRHEHHPVWDAGRDEWERWWEANKDRLLNAP
ncbi:MAG: hypothetical protein V1899_11375 [Planctomycetota bacterium]